MEAEGPLIARVYGLDQSRRGYLSVLSRVCNEVERLATNVNYDDANYLNSRLQNAWSQYEHCCGQYFALLDENCEKYNEVKSQYLMQRSRKLYYGDKLQKICEECQQCHASLHAIAESRNQSIKAAESAILIEMKTLEMEIKKRELELELTRLESEIEVNKKMRNNNNVNEPQVFSHVREQRDCASPTHRVQPNKEVPLTSSCQTIPLTPPVSIFQSTVNGSNVPLTPPVSAFQSTSNSLNTLSRSTVSANPSASNSTNVSFTLPMTTSPSASADVIVNGLTPPVSTFPSSSTHQTSNLAPPYGFLCSSTTTVRQPLFQQSQPFSCNVQPPQTTLVSSAFSPPKFTTSNFPGSYQHINAPIRIIADSGNHTSGHTYYTVEESVRTVASQLSWGGNDE